MFTPTELLQAYLQEAFAREGVPAPKTNITTWENHRRHLARQELGVLRTTTGHGPFVMRSTEHLSTDALLHPTTWFTSFDEWQRSSFLDALRDGARLLQKSEVPAFRRLGDRLGRTLARADPGTLAPVLDALATESASASKLLSDAKEQSDGRINRLLNAQLNNNAAFLDDLAGQLDLAEQHSAGDETDDEDEEDEDNVPGADDGSAPPPTSRETSINAYRRVVRAQARATASARPLRAESKSARLANWLGQRTLPESERIDVGRNLLAQRYARRFANPVRSYITGVPRRYRAFRRHELGQRWYRGDRVRPADIDPLEVDVVLLASLRAIGGLLGTPSVRREITERAWSPLETVSQHAPHSGPCR